VSLDEKSVTREKIQINVRIYCWVIRRDNARFSKIINAGKSNKCSISYYGWWNFVWI